MIIPISTRTKYVPPGTTESAMRKCRRAFGRDRAQQLDLDVSADL